MSSAGDDRRDIQAADYPSLPRLLKTYDFREDDPSKAKPLAEPLWRLLSSRVPLNVDIGPLKQTELADLMRERFTNYVYSRLVVGACFALLRVREKTVLPADSSQPPESEDVELRYVVQTVLDVDDELIDQIVSYLIPLCARILSNRQAKPNPTQAKQIRRFAVSEGHRCYMCGRELHYAGERPYPPIPDDASQEHEARIGAIRAKSAFEIEHIWAQSRGGSRHRTNLAASCNECNKIKAHLLSFADLPVEQVLTEATSVESLATALDGRARFALLARQDAKCTHCGTKFHSTDSQDLYAVKKEWSEPYHFFNVVLVCGDCRVKHYVIRARSDEHGVNLRAKKA